MPLSVRSLGRAVLSTVVSVMVAAGSLAACGTVASAGMAAQEVSWVGSIQGASGDYGFAERTNSVALTNGITVSAGRLRLSAALPVVLQSNPWVTQVGAGRFPYGGPHHSGADTVSGSSGMGHAGSGHGGGGMIAPDTGSFERIGIGDPTFFANVELVSLAGRAATISATAAAKAPVGSVNQGFSTGEWDYGGGLALSAASGRALLLLDGMYWKLGDMPGLELKDGVSYGASVGTFVGRRRVSLVASVLGSSSIAAGISAPVQLGFAVGYLTPARRSVNLGLYAGLTDSAPDISVSLGWGIPLTR